MPSAGTKSEVASARLPFRGPRSGQNCYVTAAFLDIPNKGDNHRSGYITPAFSAAQKRAALPRKPYILGIPNKGDKIRTGYVTRAIHGPARGRDWHVTLAFARVPNKRAKITCRCVNRAFPRTHKRAELLRKPSILGSPQRQARGQNQIGLPHPCLLGGPKEGRIAM